MTNITRNGTFLRDNNGLMGLLNLPFGRIMAIGVEEQIVVMTQDDAREYLGVLSSDGHISFDTASRIQKQVENNRLVRNMAEVAKRVDQYRISSSFPATRIFEPCPNCRMHGDLILNGKIAYENIIAFDIGFYIVNSLVDLGEMKPLEAVSALKQIRIAQLPIKSKDATARILNSLNQIFGGDMFDDGLSGGHGLDDLLRSVAGHTPMEYGYQTRQRRDQQDTVQRG